MSEQPATHAEHLTRQHYRRAIVLLILVALIAAAAATGPVHRFVQAIVTEAEHLIQGHAVVGALVFVLLSAAAAMAVFFSTALITPVAVHVFGPLTALLLLWGGWVLGGVVAFAIGHFLGPSVVGWFIDPERLRAYEQRAAKVVRFRHVLLFQLAVPSEIPGYVLGTAGCRFGRFLAGMAIAELPFAIGAIYLGEGFLHRNYLLLVVVGLAGLALSWIAFRIAAKLSAEPGS